MDRIVEADVEDLSPDVIVEHPAIVINRSNDGNGRQSSKAKLGASTAEELEGTNRTTSTPSRLVVGRLLLHNPYTISLCQAVTVTRSHVGLHTSVL